MDAFNDCVLQYCVVEMERALKLALLYSLAFVPFGGHFSLGVSLLQLELYFLLVQHLTRNIPNCLT